MFLVFHENFTICKYNSDALLKRVVIMGMSAGDESGKEHESAERAGGGG